jgi:hypothetical protein
MVYEPAKGSCLMDLVAQRFEDIGLVFFGFEWKGPMASVLGVDGVQIDDWISDPASLPPEIEAKLEKVGMDRIEEIQAFLFLLSQAGVSKERPDGG